MSTDGSSKRLSFLALVCLVIGNMIGIGVYVSSGYSLSDLGDARLVLIVWGIAGFHAICGAIAYATIAKRLPVSGGEFAILTRWGHPSVGFVAAWISIIAGFSAPIAASAKLLGVYAVGVLDLSLESVPHLDLWIATSVILIATFLHWIEVGVSARVNNCIVFLKLLGLGVFILLGLKHVFSGGSDGIYVSNEAQIASGALETNGLSGFWGNYDAAFAIVVAMIGSLYFTTLSYTGFNASIYLAGDYPSESLPESKGSKAGAFGRYNMVGRSMIAACLVVTLFYLLLNFVFLYSIPADQVVGAGEKFVLVVANAIGGKFVEQSMGWIILLSCLTSVLAMTITGPHVYLQLGREYGLISPSANRLRPTHIALLIQAMLTIGFVWISPIRDLVTYLGLTLTACGAMAVSSIWLAVRNQKAMNHSPLSLWEKIALVVYVGGAVVLLGAGSWIVPAQFASCMATFGIGIVIYLLVGWRSLRA